MSPRGTGQRPLALSILGVITLPIIAGVAMGALGAFGADYAVTYTGLDAGTGGPTVKPTLFIPSVTPTAPTSAPPSTAPAKTLTKTPKPKATAKALVATPAATTIQLSADPLAVSHKDRITLSGTYAAANGTVLQVQVFQGNKWKDFPVTVKVVSGKFSTFVITNQTGDVQFRVVDTKAGVESNAVTIAIS